MHPHPGHARPRAGQGRRQRAAEAVARLDRRRVELAHETLAADAEQHWKTQGDDAVEAGQQGEDDPFCRATYPWGREDLDLLGHIREINHQRLKSEVLRRGDLSLYVPDDDTLIVTRTLKGHPDYTYTLSRH